MAFTKAFASRAIIDWPGITCPNQYYTKPEYVAEYHRICLKLLSVYCNAMHAKLLKNDKRPFTFPRDVIKKYVQRFPNSSARNELRRLVKAFENFDYWDSIKQINLNRFIYFLVSEREGCAYWDIIDKTKLCINFTTIINEISKEDFELFEESQEYDELKRFGAGLMRKYSDIKVDIIQEFE